jgi:acid phosphatase (class A)
MGSCWVDPYETNDYTSQPAPGDAAEPFDPALLRLQVKAFPRRKWGADFECLDALHQFSRNYPDWRERIILPPYPGDRVTVQELRQLFEWKKTLRPQVIREIQAHDERFHLFFLGLLDINRRTHPSTYLLLKIAARIGETVMSAKKLQFNRPRPSQLYPPLAPPFDVASHAAYPSGHAMISFMLAFAGGDAVGNDPAMREALVRLAERIAWLREVAGFHYPSDTAAGRMAAAQTMEMVRTLRKYERVLAQAQAEWP